MTLALISSCIEFELDIKLLKKKEDKLSIQFELFICFVCLFTLDFGYVLVQLFGFDQVASKLHNDLNARSSNESSYK